MNGYSNKYKLELERRDRVFNDPGYINQIIIKDIITDIELFKVRIDDDKIFNIYFNMESFPSDYIPFNDGIYQDLEKEIYLTYFCSEEEIIEYTFSVHYYRTNIDINYTFYLTVDDFYDLGCMMYNTFII